MFTTVSVQLPTDTLLSLVEQLKRRQGTQDISEAITTAVELWLADLTQRHKTADPNGLHGYQWKSVFLPEGTVVRSWSYGEHNYACVEGDQLVHQGKVMSPNQFARSFARSNRNAWSDLYIRRPGDKQFKLACVLRREIFREQEEVRKAHPAAAIAPQQDVVAVTAVTSTAAPVPAAPRDTSPGEGWTLPERRKFRFRLEDVAFE
ncbi:MULTISPECIES: hypothetical protein [unclassified Duganella]|uniref:hypothetical protein n=1 Tax=unclassified Duganella TaxID=2636909 RepID=UPI000889317F|nr:MULTISPECIES: hypothetical protein [unclassified Duganella]SDF96825.1 hypothetical protein SAMN05216320_102206 [Duganella sp. OV458]SDJ07932.1 hypothetical protein SAMN05428973_102345 [Duganella sp. OV510]